MRRLALALAAFLLLGTPAGAEPQFGSGAAAANHLTPQAAAAFSKQVEQRLGAEGVRVALVFRAGRDRKDLPPGMAYTHGAFWAYQPAKADDGRILGGYAVYNLYHGDGKTLAKDRSHLVQDFPFDFVRGSTRDDIAVIVPTPEMQRRILEVMTSDTYASLHNPSYSLIANPLKSQHQNCNVFMLDVLAAAAWQTDDPRQIRANLAAHFRPQVIQAGPLQRLFGPIFNEQLRTDDQDGPIRTAGYESILRFMTANQLAQDSYIIRRQAWPPPPPRRGALQPAPLREPAPAPAP